MYHDGVTTCLACNPACTKCTGGTISECKGCANTHYLNVNTCILCDVSCNECTGPGNGNCKACSTSG